MFVRLPLLFLLLLALAFGSHPSASACASNTPQVCASACCSQAEMSCCESSKVPASQLPAQAAPFSVEGKQLMAPVLAILCLRPESVAEIPATSKQRAARWVVAPRVAVTCIRLI